MKILENTSIAPYTNYNIGGVVRVIYFPADCDELHRALTEIAVSGKPYEVLGGGTNVLFGDGYYDGAVIVTSGMDSCIPEENRLICGAGLASSRVAEIALEHGKAGLEFLYLLPGSIGGAAAMNARYDMKNISDILLYMDIVKPGESPNKYVPEEHDFEYKYNRIIREGWFICKLALEWHDGDPDEIRAAMKKVEQKRTEGRHFDYPSCGCIFKNDYEHNVRVGQLLDEMGYKGMKSGGAEVADFHANFIINKGSAAAQDVLHLIEKMEKEVAAKKGIRLEREVQIIGNFGE